VSRDGPSPFPAALRLVYVLDREMAADADRLEAACKGGVTAVWLRDPQAGGRDLYDAAGSLLLRCRRLGAALIVGDRVDVAMAVAADGVQIGHRGVPPRVVRPWYRGWLGVSCHTKQDLENAESSGADHVVLSPVFGVPMKGEPLGVSRLHELASQMTVPVVALGGIDTSNVASVRAAGAYGVGVIRAIRDAADPEAAARALSGPVTGS
jgi:thiamine-phosphate pyrophosphorylase